MEQDLKRREMMQREFTYNNYVKERKQKKKVQEDINDLVTVGQPGQYSNTLNRLELGFQIKS